MKRIAILGSTGSIGRSTLSVVESYPERFQITALAAGRNLDTAFERRSGGSPGSFRWQRKPTRKYCEVGSKRRVGWELKWFTARLGRSAWPLIRKSIS